MKDSTKTSTNQTKPDTNYLVGIISIGAVLLALATCAILYITGILPAKNVVNIYDHQYEAGTYTLDLDNDGKSDTITLSEYGRYITINGNQKLTINSHAGDVTTEECTRPSSGYGNYVSIGFDDRCAHNDFYIVDINNDGYLDIIHRTVPTGQPSPASNIYTIYNYRDGRLRAIGNTSIIGNIPSAMYVQGDKVYFDYWPHESPEDYTERCTIKLDLD